MGCRIRMLCSPDLFTEGSGEDKRPGKKVKRFEDMVGEGKKRVGSKGSLVKA